MRLRVKEGVTASNLFGNARAFVAGVSLWYGCLGTTGFAQPDSKATPVDQRVYKSVILDEPFIRACAVVVRMDGGSETEGLPAELELMNTNRKKTRLYNIASVPLTLKQTSFDKATGCTNYSVTGIPKDMIKSSRSVTIKIVDANGKKESAELAVYESGGDLSRKIPLVRVVPRKVPVALKPASESTR